MSNNELSVLLVKFDSRSRDQSILSCLNQAHVPHNVFICYELGLYAFLKGVRSAIVKQRASIVIFVGFNKFVFIWTILNWFTLRIPHVVRIGGDPIEVPWSRYKNARKYLPTLKQNRFFAVIRHCVNILTLASIRNVLVVNHELARQPRFRRKKTFFLPPESKIICKRKERDGIAPVGQINFLCVTNLNYFEKYSGVMAIVDGLKLLDIDREMTLKIVGGGDYLFSLEQFVGQNNTDFKVEVCGYQSDITRDLEEADIFLYHSTLDSWPNVIMEAMANALPIVCNYHPTFAGIFSDSQKAFLHRSGHPIEIQEDITKIVNDDTFYTRRSKQSLDRVNQVSNDLINSKELTRWLKAITHK